MCKISDSKALCLGITGGIATGKTTFVKALSRLIPSAEFFDADQCSRELLTHDSEVGAEVRLHFGDGVFTTQGEPDRAKIRDLVFEDPAKRKVLEAILHPRIRARWTSLATATKEKRSWLIVDIPLLFETCAVDYFDAIVVVACSAQNQVRRLVETRKLDIEIASKIIASQLDLNAKMQKAGHVIWNDGSLSGLEDQAGLVTDYFKKYHG